MKVITPIGTVRLHAIQPVLHRVHLRAMFVLALQIHDRMVVVEAVMWLVPRIVLRKHNVELFRTPVRYEVTQMITSVIIIPMDGVHLV